MTALALDHRSRPPHGVRLGPYVALARLGLRQELALGPALLARAVFLAVLLLVFSRLWDTVLAETALDVGEPRDLLWYVALTEWIVLSFPYVHVDVEADVRTGELIARLPQPWSYPAARVAEAAGAAAARATALGLAAVGTVLALAGGFPGDLQGLLVAVPLGLLAIAFALLAATAIGLCALWLQDPAPLFWVWQKLAFVLGGLILPLAVYPAPIREFAEWTPFGAMLNGPARQVLGMGTGDALLVAGQLVAWNAVAVMVVAWLWRRALAGLEASGG